MMMVGWYNDEAKKLVSWACDERNRIKASHIMAVAERMENRYIRNGIPATKCPTPVVTLPPKDSISKIPIFIGRSGINDPPPHGSRPTRTK